MDRVQILNANIYNIKLHEFLERSEVGVITTPNVDTYSIVGGVPAKLIKMIK